MSDFIFIGVDYIDYIKTEEDLKLFQRLRELEPELKKPIEQCIDAVIEITNVERKLRGLQPMKFITLPPNPQLN